ncbi:UNVERIFIED_CONTAM: hypothetical protein RF653_15210 [Kocuria sp. CPCC 205316]|uniref:hypothetical protein n=1 Tax=Kocuria TaxID=57493 RepID=UPI0036DAEC0F
MISSTTLASVSLTTTQVTLLPALIAAVVAVLATVAAHALTRRRDHEKWRIEQLYEATGKLSAAFHALDDAIFASPPYVTAKRLGAYPHPILDDDPHVALVKASRNYETSLDTVEMLLRDPEARMAIEGIRTQLKATTNGLSRVYEEQQVPGSSFHDIDSEHHGNGSNLTARHQGLVATLSISYFAPRKSWLRRRLLLMSVRRWARRELRIERKQASAGFK